MMKILELRDRCTFMPVMAIKFDPQNEAERYLLGRAGYGRGSAGDYVLLAEINGGDGQIHCDAFGWKDRRTMGAAHQWIEEHWNEIEHGQVIDVEFILGETAEPKKTERIDPSGI
jgi:hypothetical protein